MIPLPSIITAVASEFCADKLAKVKLFAFILPSTCSNSVGLLIPIPTFPLNSASLISPSLSTSIEGIPDTSFTEKIGSLLKSFTTENSCPALPSKLSVAFVPS